MGSSTAIADAPHTTPKSSKKSKRKSKDVDSKPLGSAHDDTIAIDENAQLEPGADSEKAKRKSKRKKESKADDGGEHKKKKRKVRVDEDTAALETNGDEPDAVMEDERVLEEKKSKKEKKEKKKVRISDVVEEAPNNKDVLTSEDTSPPKKKRKDKKTSSDKRESRKKDREENESKSRRKAKDIDEADPEGDEELNDQARKALGYAYLYVTKREQWKFAKARQNWLVRNIFSQEMIPEKYLEHANQYLQSVQGGVRENLLKLCREATVEVTSDPQPETAEGQTAEVPKPEDSVRRIRAQTLLTLLSEETS
ncbi:hypothetical protein QCA50_000251 [Cerrena zonata]|uniref:WKF domain-containing protein n=1 Tax=Cerrena zonata TaxID=2478898 RepID=A0AAW0GWP5_9APHY